MLSRNTCCKLVPRQWQTKSVGGLHVSLSDWLGGIWSKYKFHLNNIFKSHTNIKHVPEPSTKIERASRILNRPPFSLVIKRNTPNAIDNKPNKRRPISESMNLFINANSLDYQNSY